MKPADDLFTRLARRAMQLQADALQPSDDSFLSPWPEVEPVDRECPATVGTAAPEAPSLTPLDPDGDPEPSTAPAQPGQAAAPRPRRDDTRVTPGSPPVPVARVTAGVPPPAQREPRDLHSNRHPPAVADVSARETSAPTPHDAPAIVEDLLPAPARALMPDPRGAAGSAIPLASWHREPSAPPPAEISIGRVEIRLRPATGQDAVARHASGPVSRPTAVSLEEYLKRRGGERP